MMQKGKKCQKLERGPVLHLTSCGYQCLGIAGNVASIAGALRLERVKMMFSQAPIRLRELPFLVIVARCKTQGPSHQV